MLHVTLFRDGTSQNFRDLTSKSQNLRRLTGWLTVFLQKIFVSCSMQVIKIFEMGGGAWVRR